MTAWNCKTAPREQWEESVYGLNRSGEEFTFAHVHRVQKIVDYESKWRENSAFSGRKKTFQTS